MNAKSEEGLEEGVLSSGLQCTQGRLSRKKRVLLPDTTILHCDRVVRPSLLERWDLGCALRRGKGGFQGKVGPSTRRAQGLWLRQGVLLGTGEQGD